MAGDFSGEKSATENEWVNLLKDLELSQIAQVFNDFCFDCKSVLRSRLLNLHKQGTLEEENEKLGTSSIPCFETKLLSSPANGESSKLARQTEDDADKFSSPPMNGKPLMRGLFGHQSSPSSSNHTPSPSVSNGSPNEEEWRKFSQVGRKKDFVHYERIKGKDINVLQGLELHTGVFSPEEQKKIVDSVYNFQKMGQKKQLMQRTYTEPAKWMRGKGRVTIQFGCCYNYAVVLMNILSTRGVLEQGSCLDALIALMLDSSANQMDFETCNGIEEVAAIIRDKQVDENLRMKCGEFLLLLIGHIDARDMQPMATVHDDIRRLLGEKSASLIWAASQFGSTLDPEERLTALHIQARRVLESLDLFGI